MRIEWIQEFHIGAIFFSKFNSSRGRNERKNEKEKEKETEEEKE